MNRGKPLELAIGRAARAYRREGRLALVRQHTPTATGKDGFMQYSAAAPIDFLGTLAGGKALAVEAKSTSGTSWPIAELREDQQTALGAMHSLGAVVYLVLSFDKTAETYRVGWPELAAFLARPWRESLTPTWCQAFGLLVPETDRDDSTRRRCMLLDAQEAPGAAQARLAQVEEQQRALSRPAKPEPCQEALPLAPPAYPKLTEEERRARIVDACNEGIARQLKKAAQAQRFAPGRGRR